MNPEFNTIFAAWTGTIGEDMIKMFLGLFVLVIFVWVFIDQYI